jgi:hypothetical protein
MHSSLSQRARRASKAVALAAAMALAAIAIVVVPANATTPPPEYGSTLQCRYHGAGPGPAYNFRLKKFVVSPPEMKANSGTQRVGWRFVVTRSLNNGDAPWKTTYRSLIQKASATTTEAAEFTTRSVEVALPHVDNLSDVVYQVTLKMFWYRHDGSVQTQTSFLMTNPVVLLNGQDGGDGDGTDACLGSIRAGP